MPAGALSALARQARKLEIGIDGPNSFATAGLTDIPVPVIDLTTRDDPLPLIFEDPRYRDTIEQLYSDVAAQHPSALQ